MTHYTVFLITYRDLFTCWRHFFTLYYIFYTYNFYINKTASRVVDMFSSQCCDLIDYCSNPAQNQIIQFIYMYAN